MLVGGGVASAPIAPPIPTGLGTYNCVRGTRTQPLICVGVMCIIGCPVQFIREVFSRLHVRRRHTLGNLRTTTTALSTTTGELQCTAQARLVNFVVGVLSTTPNIVESRRPAIHKLQNELIQNYSVLRKRD